MNKQTKHRHMRYTHRTNVRTASYSTAEKLNCNTMRKVEVRYEAMLSVRIFYVSWGLRSKCL